MSVPVPLRAAELLDFVAGPGPTVVFVSVHPWHTFNQALGDRLGQDVGEVRCGTVALPDLLLSAAAARPFLQAVVVPGILGVLPGYWLFRRGRVLAWDSGLPAASDAPALARGALLGALWSALTRRLAFLGLALRLAVDEIAARRVALGFRAAAARPDPAPGPGAWDAWPPRPGPSASDLRRAYETLGVAPSASDEEVKRAWRRRQLEIHPDRAANDPSEFERRTRLAAELNGARELIMRARRREDSRARSAAG